MVINKEYPVDGEIVLTQDITIPKINNGYKPDGSRHPHSWSIVDEKELIDWFLKVLSP